MNSATFHGRVAFGLALVALAACESPDRKNAPIAPRSRSQAVLGSPTAQPPEQPVPTPEASSPARPKRSGVLCSAGAHPNGKKLPSDPIGARARPGDALPSLDRYADGQSWVWVNFWAAWCAPCKEEIPRLRSWEQKLRSEGLRVSVAFVSVDDDERQLSAYLASSGVDGLGATLWLREGKERSNWLESVGVSSDPELPLHLLVSPGGQVRCVIQGAVDDEDYQAVKAVLAGR